MVVIQCPHCYKDVELESGVSGLFDCPYCNNEFEYEPKQTKIQNYTSAEPKLSKSAKNWPGFVNFLSLFLYFDLVISIKQLVITMIQELNVRDGIVVQEGEILFSIPSI